MTTIQKISSSRYNIFILGDFTETEKTIEVSQSAKGFVVCVDGSSTTVKTFGDVKSYEIYKSRQVSFPLTTKNFNFNINGFDYGSQGFSWIRDLDCFVKADGENITISMMKNGVICVNYSVLYVFKDVVMREPLKLKGRIVECETSQVTEFIKDGVPIYAGNCLTTRKKSFELDPNEPITEHMYLRFSDSTYADITVDNLEIKDVVVSENDKEANFLENYRCVPLKTISMPLENKSVLQVMVTRYNNNSPTVKINFSRFDRNRYNLSSFNFDLFHEKQDCSINFAIYGVKKISVSDTLVFSPTTWFTQVECLMDNDTIFKSKIYRNIIPYNIVQGGIYRYKSVNSFDSDILYIYDGVVYSESSEFVSFTGRFLTLKRDPAPKSFGLYSMHNSTWTIYDLRLPILYDPEYNINVFTDQKTEFDMYQLGSHDGRDVLTFSNSKNGKYKFSVKKGEPLTVPFTSTSSEGTEYKFTVTFTYEEYMKTSFIIPGDEFFSTRIFRQGSFSGSISFMPYWTCGPYVGKKGSTINVEGKIISEDSDDTLIYPIISFSELQVGNVRNTKTSLPIVTKVLTEDLKIPLQPSEKYIRLSGCGDVVYDSNTIKVPQNTGVCLFVGGKQIYLLRSSLVKTVSFASFSKTPKSEDGSPYTFSGFTFPSEESVTVNPMSAAVVAANAVVTAASSPARLGPAAVAASVFSSISALATAVTSAPINQDSIFTRRRVAPIQVSAAVVAPVVISTATPVQNFSSSVGSRAARQSTNGNFYA